MPCDEDPSECTIKRGLKFYLIVGIFVAISAGLYAGYITLTLYKRKHFIHYAYTLPVYFYFFMRYRGTETVDHGLYNAFGFIGFLIILVYLFSFICGIFC